MTNGHEYHWLTEELLYGDPIPVSAGSAGPW